MSKEIDSAAYWEALHTETRERVQEQAETQQASEIDLLTGASSAQEYIARRRAMPFLMVEPDEPLDQLSTSDYFKARQRDRAANRPVLKMGELSYAEFKNTRDGR